MLTQIPVCFQQDEITEALHVMGFLFKVTEANGKLHTP